MATLGIIRQTAPLAVIMAAFFALTCGFPARLGAQNRDQPKKSQALEKQLKQIHTLADTFKFHRDTNNGPVEAKLIKGAVHQFKDVERNHFLGTVWAWGRVGRPIAMLELYTDGKRDRYDHAFVSTTTQTFTAKRKGKLLWTPKIAGVSPKTIPKAPQPATKKDQRLAQMKKIARRFKAHEFWDPNNTRYDLRLLTRPIHRYSDPKSGMLDGGVFIFTHGTNPEIFLFVEALSKDGKPTTWQYAAARTANAEVHVELDGRDVWHKARTGRIRSTDPYWLFSIVP